MKKRLLFLLGILIGISNFNYAQSGEAANKSNFGIGWYGFVKNDIMYDTRQTIYAREGHFAILPKPAVYDADGEDINAISNFNMLTIQTRLGVKITGPDFFGMKTSGLIEAAFFGNTDQSIGEFRLRHAFVKLSNEKIEILIGQYWHPMFVTAVFPGVYSFNTGVPFQPFARNPQIRLTTKGKVKLMVAAFTERDFQTRGASVSQSGVPSVHAQLQFGDANNTVGGIGYNLKTTRPNFPVDVINDRMTSSSGIAYFKTKLGEKSWWKLEGIYGQNMSELLQVSGFGQNTNGDYLNNTTFSAWTEFMGDISESVEWGVFGGYTNNGGFDEEVTSVVGGFLGNNTQYAYRVAPRIGWKSGNLTIGLELELTTAQYGEIDNVVSVSPVADVDPVTNFRILTTAIYKF